MCFALNVLPTHLLLSLWSAHDRYNAPLPDDPFVWLYDHTIERFNHVALNDWTRSLAPHLVSSYLISPVAVGKRAEAVVVESEVIRRGITRRPVRRRSTRWTTWPTRRLHRMSVRACFSGTSLRIFEDTVDWKQNSPSTVLTEKETREHFVTIFL